MHNSSSSCASLKLPRASTCQAGDQLFRNAFRGTAKMYAADDKVLAWAKALLVSVQWYLRGWHYLPASDGQWLPAWGEGRLVLGACGAISFHLNMPFPSIAAVRTLILAAEQQR